MRSKVRIPLSANNSLGQPTSKARVSHDPCGGGALQGFKVYLTWVGTRSGPILEGFLVIKKEEVKFKMSLQRGRYTMHGLFLSYHLLCLS